MWPKSSAPPAASPAVGDYIAGLDGLRAISITLVVLGHLGFGMVVPGALGVTIFFFISGFLITRLLWSERERNGGLDLWRFYGRRFLRLLPEMVVLLAMLAFVIGPLTHRPLPALQAAAALTYWTNYHIIFGLGAGCDHCAVTGHLWSLAVEEHFYLVMPLALILCAFAPRRLMLVFGAVAVACLAWRTYATVGLHLSDIYTYKATECRLDAMGWGCLAAVAERAWPVVGETVRRHGRAVFGAGVALMLASLAWRDETFRATLRYTVQSVALVAIVLPLVVAPKLSPLVRMLEWAPMRWMGRRSYAAYLWHYVALLFAALAFGFDADIETAPHALQLQALPLVLGGTWLLAELSYRLVYQPSQRLKPWLTPTRKGADGLPRAAGEVAAKPTEGANPIRDVEFAARPLHPFGVPLPRDAGEA